MQIRKMSFGAKIYLGQGLTTGFLLMLGVATIWSMTSVDRMMKTEISNTVRKTELAGQISTQAAAAKAAARGVMLGALTSNADQAQTSQQSIRQSTELLSKALNEIGPMLVTGRGKQLHSSLRNSESEWERGVAKFLEDVQAQRFDVATATLADQLTPVAARLTADALELSKLQEQLMETTRAEASSSATFWRWVTVLLSLLALGVAGVAFWVVRNGNTVLRSIATEIGEGARQVATASHQVSSSSQALAQGSSEQAASLEETSASTEEINAMTQKNAENAKTTAGEMDRTDQALKETDERLKRMIGSMQQINTSSEKISKIIKVIDEIAFQTNILALNAAVEAARAGEAGMGFAVVADEVRNLAQRCAQAAKDTSELIEESIVSSNEGKERLDKVAASVSGVYDAAARGKLLANEVHVGSQEQARGIEQILRAITQMQQVTQATAASAEQGASAGEEMSAQAQSLQDAVERLRDLVGGSSNQSATPVRAAEDRRFALKSAAPKPQALKAPVGKAAGTKPAQATEKAPATVGAGAKSGRFEIPMDDDFKEF
jgi:methyl-accepting chemotaxis protein/methyl-accepting chemotaxis protein-1 (serine sensor receptor)